MREGKWELLVLVDGKPLPEHIIWDGRKERHCVEAQPGAQFVVTVIYHGNEMHVIDVLVDGEAVSSRLMIDRTGTTNVDQGKECRIAHWIKRKDGTERRSDLVFAKTEVDGAGDTDTGIGMAAVIDDWSRGFISLRVYAGKRRILKEDKFPANHQPEISKKRTLSEVRMVKGGHSATASAGKKYFATSHVFRKGQILVSRASDAPREMKIYYRDSFFLLLKGDKSKVIDRSLMTDLGSCSDGIIMAQENLRRYIETTQQLAKRHNTASDGKPQVIDLTDETPDKNGGMRRHGECVATRGILPFLPPPANSSSPSPCHSPHWKCLNRKGNFFVAD